MKYYATKISDKGNIAVGIVGIALAEFFFEELETVKVDGILVIVANQQDPHSVVVLFRNHAGGNKLPAVGAVGIWIEVDHRFPCAAVGIVETIKDTKAAATSIA